MSLRALLFISILLFLWAYTFLKLRSLMSSPTRRSGPATVGALAVSTALMALAISGQVVYRSWEPNPAGSDFVSTLLAVSAWFIGLLAMAWIIWILVDLATLAIASIQHVSRLAGRTPNVERRRFFQRAGTAGAAVFAALGAPAGLAQAALATRVRKVSIPIPGLHPDLDGLKIAQISDLHVGPTIHADRTREVVDTTNALGADLIAVTGDMVDGTIEQLREHVAPLADLKAPYGVFYVTGNHEYYWGAKPWIEHFAGLGMLPLINENRLIPIGQPGPGKSPARLLLAGVPDPQGKHFLAGHEEDFVTAARLEGHADLRILLAHRPSAYAQAAQAGFDLQLSGHTHAGQFFPWSLVMPFAHRYYRGLNRHADKLWVYVNSGTGYWGPPNRFLIPSEITLIELNRA